MSLTGDLERKRNAIKAVEKILEIGKVKHDIALKKGDYEEAERMAYHAKQGNKLAKRAEKNLYREMEEHGVIKSADDRWSAFDDLELRGETLPVGKQWMAKGDDYNTSDVPEYGEVR